MLHIDNVKNLKYRARNMDKLHEALFTDNSTSYFLNPNQELLMTINKKQKYVENILKQKDIELSDFFVNTFGFKKQFDSGLAYQRKNLKELKSSTEIDCPIWVNEGETLQINQKKEGYAYHLKSILDWYKISTI